MPMKNSSDTIGDRTRNLPTCSAVPQPTAPPRAPSDLRVEGNSGKNSWNRSRSFLVCPITTNPYHHHQTSINSYLPGWCSGTTLVQKFGIFLGRILARVHNILSELFILYPDKFWNVISVTPRLFPSKSLPSNPSQTILNLTLYFPIY